MLNVIFCNTSNILYLYRYAPLKILRILHFVMFAQEHESRWNLKKNEQGADTIHGPKL